MCRFQASVFLLLLFALAFTDGGTSFVYEGTTDKSPHEIANTAPTGSEEPTSATTTEPEFEKIISPITEETAQEFMRLLNAATTIEPEFETIVSPKTEEAAQEFMRLLNDEASEWGNNVTIKNWNYSSNITDENKEAYLEAVSRYGDYAKERWNRIQEWKSDWPTFTNENLRRQFEKYSVLGEAALPKEKYDNLTAILAEMEETYGKAKICDFFNATKCDLSLEPELVNIMKSSRNYDELTHVWTAWRDAAGKPNRNSYTEFVKLSNEAADMNEFPTTAEMWMHDYESDTFEDDLQALYYQLSPFYKQLHAYTRRKLREVYGESKIPKRGPIPAHLTGNMWAQSWENIYDILVPFPNKTSVDVTDTMKAQNYTPRLMFEKADAFFVSMGLEKVSELFWNNSIIEKPEGRELVCHASAWDFVDGKDFRIKQCTRVDMNDFFTVHHELGHIQYYMQYKHLPTVFREGANPGFHEAVGDVLSLSVSTPKHLHKVGLLDSYETDDEADINFLLKMSLSNVAFLPFGYMIDKYRWDIMRGNITPGNYTKAWWEHRLKFQGISPPVERTENDFDPAAKYHVSGNMRYVRYFVARILQFQFYNASCVLAKEHDPLDPLKPLHRCDIYQSLEAGKALKDMLRLGSSVHWSQPLKALTGKETMDASALREYFRPLEKWLTVNNEEHGEFVGWE